MEVDIQIERGPESLDQYHRAGVTGLRALAGLVDQMGGNHPVDETQHAPHELRAASKQESQRKGEAEHPLTHGLFGQHLIDQ